MSQISYRANLSAAIFPLSLAQAGRSVIVPGPDNVYDRRVDPEGEQKNAGIPQAIYLENVIPTANGYQSVGYDTQDTLPFTEANGIWQIPVAASDQIVLITLTYKANNEWYSSDFTGMNNWTRLYDIFPAFPFTQGVSGRVTYAVVRGVCYILIPNGASTRLFTATYVGPDITLTDISGTLSGIAIADVREICSAFNYLVLFDVDDIVHWSSTTNPLDFTISLVTGAGSASPNNAYNKINYIEACPSGFYLFTPTGLIFAQYTGNSRYPWRFNPVVNTTQILSFSHQDVNASTVIVVDGTGSIRAVEGQNANLIAPELGAFLRQVTSFDVYNHTTGALSSQVSYSDYYPKVYLLYDRYILMSGDGTATDLFSAIYFYDIQLKRYGKLKVLHTDILLYDDNTLDITRNRIGVVNNYTGACHAVNMNLSDSSGDHQGVLILGKFQYARSRFLQLHSIELEGNLVDVSMAVLPSLNGKTFETPVAPYIQESSSTLLIGLCREDAKNHSAVIKGKFSLESVELSFTPTSDR